MFVLMISRSSLKVGHLGSKARSLKENLFNTLMVAFFGLIIMNLAQNVFVLLIFRSGLKLGNLVNKKTRSPGQIKGKPCEHSSSHLRDYHESCSKFLSFLMISRSSLELGPVFDYQLLFKFVFPI